MTNDRILVISDAHGSTSVVEALLGLPQMGLCAVFHLGDGDRSVRRLMGRHPELAFIGVPGNCDSASDFPPDADGKAVIPPLDVFTEYGGVRMMLTHGHKHNVKLFLTAAANAASEGGADILLFGHTHKQTDRTVSTPQGDVRAVNPGSVRDGRYAVLTLSDGHAEFELLTFPALPAGVSRG